MTSKDRVLQKYPNAYSGGDKGGWYIWINDYDEIPLGKGPTAQKAWQDAARNLERNND